MASKLIAIIAGVGALFALATGILGREMREKLGLAHERVRWSRRRVFGNFERRSAHLALLSCSHATFLSRRHLLAAVDRWCEA